MTHQLLQKLSQHANSIKMCIDDYTRLIEWAQNSTSTIATIEKEKTQTLAIAQDKIRILNEEIDEIRRQCTHPITTFNQGCSGIKSYYECDLCGKEVNK